MLFDLDGTLLDTLEDLADSMNITLEKMGYPVHPVERYKVFVGDGMETEARRALGAGGDEATVARCLELSRAEYAKRWANKTRPYPGIAELLDELQRRNIPKAIVSNKPDDFTQLTVKKLLGRWRWEAVTGVSERIAKKPDPAGALAAAAKIGIEPARVLY